MSELPTTPGSLIMAAEPEFYPEELGRYMGEVWQLQDDGLWQELTDNGKRGARMGSDYFDRSITVLYVAPEDPKPFEDLRRAAGQLRDYERNAKRAHRALEDHRRLVENLREACK